MIKLSVIIPTYERPEVLGMVLRSLEKQNCSQNQFEVLVVDDGSSPLTQNKIKRILDRSKLNIALLKQDHQGPAAARNKGIKKAKGEIVLIINNDTIAHPDLLKRHIGFHQKHLQQNFGLLGYVTWHPDLKVTPFMYWLEHGGPYFSFNEIEGKEAGWERLWTCNVSFKREFLLKNGLFDEEFPHAAWEDVELGYRLGKAGLRLFYDQKALGYHHHPTTIRSIKNKMRANGESALLLKKKVPFNFLPPLAKYPRLAVFLDSIFFPKPLFFLLEKLALWAEKRLNLGIIFDLALLHYRIEGLRIWHKKKK